MKTRSLAHAMLGGAAILSAPVAAQAQSSTADIVIVTGQSFAEDPAVVADARDRLSRTPGAVSAVANESFESRTAQSLGDMLRDVPGVLAQKRYGEESRFSIRGSGIDQSYHQRGVLFAQDGVPFADADGFSDFQKIDPLTARYVEVYRGGNALRFGGAQLGGAVNLVTPTGRTAQSENLIRAEGGSFGLARAGIQLARTNGDWDGFAAVTGMRADGYREHAEQEQLRGTVNLGRSFGEDREIRLIVYGADIDQQVPGALTLANALTSPRMANPASLAADSARDQTLWRSTLQTRWRLNPSTLFEGGVYATGMDLYHPISLLIDQQSWTQGAFGRFDWEGEVAGHRTDVFWGAAYRQGFVDQLLGPILFPIAGDSRREATGLDLFMEGRWFVTRRLAVVAGGSYGSATRDYTDNLNAANNDSVDFDWLAPRIGLLWEDESGLQLYANVTRSVEPPHYGALVQAPFPGFVPVNPQEAWTGEAGARGRTGPVLWDVTFYRSELEGELLTFNNAYGLPSAFANAGDTVHQGLEAALDWTILRAASGVLNLRGAWTWSDFSFDGDPAWGDNRLPVAPEHQLNATLRWRSADGWFIAPSVEWRPEDVWVDYANTMTAPGYDVWSLNAGWDFAGGVSLFVDVRNVFDTAWAPEFGAISNAAAAGANLAVFYPGEGRAIFGGLSARF